MLAEDVNPPRLSVTSREAYVTENAAVGTMVTDKRDNPIKFTVQDADWVSRTKGVAFLLLFHDDFFLRRIPTRPSRTPTLSTS